MLYIFFKIAEISKTEADFCLLLFLYLHNRNTEQIRFATIFSHYYLSRI